MIQIPGLTLERLLDHVEGLARRRAAGRTSIEARAYAADAAGRVSVFGFPVPADDAGRHALGLLLQQEMGRRKAVMSVLALEATVRGGGPRDAPVDCLVLEGQQIAPVPRSAVRLLAIERAGRGRRISGLRLLPAPSQGPGAGPGAAPGTAPGTAPGAGPGTGPAAGPAAEKAPARRA